MRCPACGIENQDDVAACISCGAELPSSAPEQGSAQATMMSSATPAPGVAPIEGDGQATIMRPTATTPVTPVPGGAAAATPAADATMMRSAPPATPTAWSAPGVADAPMLTPSGTLPDGAVLGGRYRIDKMLGTGGMGSVYKAYDTELERPVALKLIRSDLASNAAVLQRFKQEIILSREVTHPNVVRIFDLGTSDGLKYITMEFVQGRDLKDVIVERGKIPHEDAVGLMLQMSRALEAAHGAGVVHRDLKPQNVMVTADGVAKVMDFGIARSMELTGMTSTGEMLGTPAYMSPEQAKGQPVDARSDVFSLGIIFWEMLTGKLPFEAETAMGALMRRIQEKALPPNTYEEDLPAWLNGVVVRCLERDKTLRYQDAAAIVKDLEAHKAPPQPTVFDRVPAQLASMSSGGRKVLAASLVGAVALIGGVAFVVANWPAAGTATEEAAIEPIGLAILPFRNASGDASLDWIGSSVGEMLRTDIGQSAYLRTVPSDRVQQVLADLRLGATATLDGPTLDRVANFSRARNLVTGQYLKVGQLIRFDATLHDLDGGREVALKAEAPSEEAILAAIGELAASIRGELDLGSEAVAALEASSFTPTTTSVEALRLYNEGLAFERDANYLAARDAYRDSLQADGNFALAHSRLALAWTGLGYDAEAEDESRTAVDMSAELGEFEKRLIAAAREVATRNAEGAVAAYEELAAVAPEDPDIALMLVSLLERAGRFDDASTTLDRVLQADPGSVAALLLQGRLEARAGDPQAALQPLEQALEELDGTDNPDGRGRVLYMTGFAYGEMSRPEEAVRYYDESLEVFRGIGQKQGTAGALSSRARVKSFIGDPDGARADFEEALALHRDIGDRAGVGNTLVNLGNYWATYGDNQRAIDTLKEALQVQREVGNEGYAALCLNNLGTVYQAVGEWADALTYFEQAYALRQGFNSPGDLGETLHNLGETQLALGNYEEALDYLLQGIEQWRTIGDDFGIAAETYDIGIIRGYQGNYQAALEAETDARTTLEGLGMREDFFFYATGQLGIALAEIGRLDDAPARLQEALTVAQELQNDSLVAQAHEWRGAVRRMQLDTAGARSAYQDAAAAAERAGNARAALSARLRLAILDVMDGKHAAGSEAIGGMLDRARQLGLAYIATEAALVRAQALVQLGDADAARREAQGVQRTAERYSLNPLRARAHYVLGLAAAAGGDDAGRDRQFQQAAAVLAEIAAASGSDDPFRRPDLQALRTAISG